MKKLLIIASTILILDFIWINFYLINPVSKMIENIQKSPMKAKPLGVLIAYAILIYFAYLFIPKMNSSQEAFLLGFLVYAIYDSTNYATITNWNLKVAIIDSLWGGFLFYMVYNILQLFY